jgi:cytoskeleton protein RodZ
VITTPERPATERNLTTEKTLKVGAVLIAAREKMNLSENDAAIRLRLKPRIIKALENEQFDSNLPPIFIRGYLKSYAKLLNLSDGQIIQLTTQLKLTAPPPSRLFATDIMPEQSYFGWVLFSAIALTLILGGIWWTKHADEPFLNSFSPTHALNSLESLKNSIMEPANLADTLPAPTIENSITAKKSNPYLNELAISQGVSSAQFNPAISNTEDEDDN